MLFFIINILHVIITARKKVFWGSALTGFRKKSIRCFIFEVKIVAEASFALYLRREELDKLGIRWYSTVGGVKLFWRHKLAELKMTVNSDYAICERLKVQLDALRPFPQETLDSLKKYYRVGLTYSSNALEGNSLTESETKVVIEDGLTVDGKPLSHVYEALGHADAYDFIYTLVKHRKITLNDVMKIHDLFYRRSNFEQAGKIRTGQVFISGSRYKLPKPADLPEHLTKFIDWFQRSERLLHPVEFAALVHQKFVFIHPFVDGNGRVARLLMNLALLRAGYPIAIIPPVLRREYIAALETAHRSTKNFCAFIAQRVIETEKDLLRLFDVKPDIGGVKIGGVKTEVRLLDYIKANPGCNTPKIISDLNLATRTTQRYLKKLTDEKKIEFRGAPKNGGFYERRNNPVKKSINQN